MVEQGLGVEVGIQHVNSVGPQTAQAQNEKNIIFRKRFRDLINNQSKHMLFKTLDISYLI